MTDAALSDALPRTDFLGHPKGLYVCFFTEMWERFSFYGMKALLLLYLIKYHRFSDDHGYNLIGAYGGLVYAAPVFGGLVADRWLGMRKSILLGGVLLCLGHFAMAVEGHPARVVDGVVMRDTRALQVFYFALALIIVGVGFLKANVSTLVGKLYAEQDPRREAGFSIYYAGVNLGGVISGVLCGWLGETFGWGYGFGAAGVGMLFGLATFVYGQRYLLGRAEPPDAPRLRERLLAGLSRETWIYVATFGGVLVGWQLIQRHSLMLDVPGLPQMSAVLWGMHAISVVLLGWIAWFLIFRCNRVQRQQMLVLLVLIVCCLVFFTLYEQTYGSWLLFSDRVMNRETNLFGWHYEWTAGQLTSLGSLFILLLAPILAWLWPRLDRLGINPSKPMKSALGLIVAGLAFLVLVWSARHPQANGMTALWCFVLAYFVLEVGEMLLSPIGLAAVTELSVPSVMGVMMGAWWLGTAYSEVLAALLGKLSAIQLPEDGAIVVADALAKYDALFVYSAKIGIAAGLLILLLTPLLKRGMHGAK
ncbi:peptide MFS transporter [Solimonas sp. C16B3]|uniref:Peptide MFS transporter n=2 Tax=Solimonas marina TaxID=2714601 RepID=A0A969WBE9_9GAMM|nr:peptide MFS transporter [Solimonas marina]